MMVVLDDWVGVGGTMTGARYAGMADVMVQI